MDKRKTTNGQTMIYKTLNRKQKIEKHELTKSQWLTQCSGRIGSSCSTSGTRRVTLVTKSVISLMQVVWCIPRFPHQKRFSCCPDSTRCMPMVTHDNFGYVLPFRLYCSCFFCILIFSSVEFPLEYLCVGRWSRNLHQTAISISSVV